VGQLKRNGREKRKTRGEKATCIFVCKRGKEWKERLIRPPIAKVDGQEALLGSISSFALVLCLRTDNR